MKQLTIASRTLASARSAGRAAAAAARCPWTSIGAGARGRRHRRHRDRIARAGADARRRRGRDAAAARPSAVRDRHRRAARRRARGRQPRSGLPLQHRRPAGDRQGEPGAPQHRGRARRVDRRARKSTGSAPGCSRATWCRRWWRCGSASRRSAAAELQRLEPSWRSLPPEARARVDEITHLIVEKLLLTPTEQLKAADDEATAVAYADALNRLFSLPPRKRGPRRVMTALRIGTRGSAARVVAGAHRRRAARARTASPPRSSPIKTSGDRLQDAPLSETGSKGLFVKEIEDALLSRRGRSRGPQRQGHVGDAARRPGDRGGAAARGSARRARAAARRAGSADLDALVAGARRPSSDRARAASAARRSCARSFPDARFLPCAATSTRGCASSTPGSSTRWCSPSPGLKRLGYGRPHHAGARRRRTASPLRARASSRSRRARDVPDGAAPRSMTSAAGASFRAERALVAALGGGCQLPLGAIADASRRRARDGRDRRLPRRDAPGAPRDDRAIRPVPKSSAPGSPTSSPARGAIAILDEVR